MGITEVNYIRTSLEMLIQKLVYYEYSVQSFFNWEGNQTTSLYPIKARVGDHGIDNKIKIFNRLLNFYIFIPLRNTIIKMEHLRG